MGAMVLNLPGKREHLMQENWARKAEKLGRWQGNNYGPESGGGGNTGYKRGGGNNGSEIDEDDDNHGNGNEDGGGNNNNNNNNAWGARGQQLLWLQEA